MTLILIVLCSLCLLLSTYYAPCSDKHLARITFNFPNHSILHFEEGNKLRQTEPLTGPHTMTACQRDNHFLKSGSQLCRFKILISITRSDWVCSD